MASISPSYLNNKLNPFEGKDCYVRLTITGITQTDGGTNQTTVNWQLSVEGEAYVYLYACRATLGGVELYDHHTGGAILTSWSAGKVFASGSKTFDNNSDGSLSLVAYVKQMFYYGNGDTTRWTNSYFYQENSTTMVCSQIPRYPVLSYNTVSTTLNTMTCGLSNLRPGTMTKYQVQRISDGVNVIDTTCNGTFSFTLTGLTPNTDQSGKYKVRAYANGGWGDWLTLYSDYDTTKTLPTLTVTNKAGLEDNVTLQFSNLNHIDSFRFTIDVCNPSDGVWISKGIGERTDITTNNYLFKLTEAEITTLLNYFKTLTKPWVHLVVFVKSNNIEYQIRTSANENWLITYTIPDTSKYQPTFPSGNLTGVKDLLHTAITGNASKFIQNHNRLQGTITPMVMKYGASGKSYAVTVGSKTKSVNYSTANQNFTIDNVDGTNMSVVAVDSRGKSTTISTNVTIVPYANPSVDEYNLTRQNGTGTYAILEASGKYTNWSGLTVSNKIKKIEYRWKKSTDADSSYSSWINIPTFSNSNGQWFVSQVLETVFNNTLQYHIQIRITDELETVVSKVFLLSTADVFIWKDLANKRLGIKKKPERDLDVGGEIGCTAIYLNGKKVIWEE